MSARKRIPGITITQRGYGAWEYRVSLDPDPLTGKRPRVTKGGFETYADALNAAVEANQLAELGQAPVAKRIKVSDFFHQWLEAAAPNLKPSTEQNYRDNIDSYIVPVLGDKWLGKLTIPTINAFYKHLSEKGRRKVDVNAQMYAYWLPRKEERNGLGPNPKDLANRFDITLQGAQAAARRYRNGRIPQEQSTGLSPKSVRNIHVVMRRALRDAVLWGYLYANPAESAIVPRSKSRTKKAAKQTWTVEELVRWLSVALRDRYAGMWLLAANTGMRRSELGGVERSMLDLDHGRLAIGDTRIVVAGKAERSDGKTDSSVRPVSLDAFTVHWLKRYNAMIEEERQAHGKDYPDHDYLMAGPEGRPLHPDTITARFNRLVDQAGAPRIRLHDVRHTYATIALDRGISDKIIGDRLGHANPTVTKVIYAHRSEGLDRPMADELGELIQTTLAAVDPEIVADFATESDPQADAETPGPEGEAV
jgi:integrase